MSIEKILKDGIQDLVRAINPQGGIVFTIGPFEESKESVKTPQYKRLKKGKVIGMAVLKATQKVRVEVSFNDSRGNPAPVDGLPQWSTDNPDTVALQVDPDGMGVWVSAVGVGSASVNVKADADMGEGFKPIEGAEGFSVIPAEASVVALKVFEPVEQ